MGALLWGTALCGYDVCFRRLPDWLTLPAWAVAVWWYPGAWWGGLLWAALYFRRGIGGGDMKLALSLGTFALAAGVAHLLGAMVISSLVTVLLCLVFRRPAIAHGPSMIAATWLVLDPRVSGQIGGISF